ncbi:MAG: hypothetical protein A4E51_00061 [Methanosaeta sp. PtaU1.Bin055]|nr:MAG: hypothetical protein A4E51_00061 [Methanosaeta sp. PtaU1.Bin055]
MRASPFATLARFLAVCFAWISASIPVLVASFPSISIQAESPMAKISFRPSTLRYWSVRSQPFFFGRSRLSIRGAGPIPAVQMVMSQSRAVPSAKVTLPSWIDSTRLFVRTSTPFPARILSIRMEAFRERVGRSRSIISTTNILQLVLSARKQAVSIPVGPDPIIAIFFGRVFSTNRLALTVSSRVLMAKAFSAPSTPK